METFCTEYAKLIEMTIAESNGGRCPKIQANYDDFNDQTIRPLNSTIFYFYFSGSRYRKVFAQFLASAAQYPNAKVKRAYMRFFA